MSRRSNRKTGNPEAEPSFTISSVSPGLAKRTKTGTVKIEVDEVVTNARSPAKPSRKKAKKEESEAELEIPIEPIKRKINSVKGKATLEALANGQKPSVKRKAKGEPDDENGGNETKTKKKRMTKEEKEAEAMPILPRTAVSALKKAMYIGAHVSGAGGMKESVAHSSYY